MTRTLRHLIVGVTLGLTCVACSTPDAATSGSSHTPKLLKLPTVDVEGGDPFSELDVTLHEPSRRVIGEVDAGDDRIVLYTEGQKCGVVAFSSKAFPKPSLQILASWPKKSNEGSSRLPFGPYMRSSGFGSGDTPTWADIWCGKDAFVVNYTIPGASKGTRYSGSVSVSHSTDRKSISIVAGNEDVREEILSALSAM